MKASTKIYLSILSGLLLTLAWPHTGGLSFLIVVAFVPLLLVEKAISIEQNTRLNLYAYIAFSIWIFLTCWWLYFASYLGVVMAVVCQGLIVTTVFFAFHLAKKHLGDSRGYLALITFWISWEYFHMHWDLSFPWLTLGHAFSNTTFAIQWYEYTGVFGGTLWILILNIIAYKFVSALWFEKRKLSELTMPISLFILLLVVPVVISVIMFLSYKEVYRPVEVVVLQPNIDPYNEKFDGLSVEEQVKRMIHLAETKITDKTDFIVAPETALPRPLWEDQIIKSEEYNDLFRFIEKHPHSEIVIGISSLEAYISENEKSSTARKGSDGTYWYDFYNSAMHMNASGLIDIYHKSKLVLGVEKMPYPTLFKPLENLAVDLGGTIGSLGVQEDRSVFTGKNEIKVAPVICYESVYGEYVGEYVKNGANLIFIITNDGWWDDTPGYKQHLAYARLRAIETRRSIARSANTGISCFINQRGDVSQATHWWKKDVIEGSINANDKLTFYTQNGDYIARVASFLSALLILWTFVNSKRNSKV